MPRIPIALVLAFAVSCGSSPACSRVMGRASSTRLLQWKLSTRSVSLVGVGLQVTVM